ncbi:hypothetical protein HYH03_006560 [Edaphochlamys debaryana]|uniref:Cilia-and flagella-associated protein 96 n=1 Tax=Edaphochlamys debaryana TaxID=47281 RepID=A0A835Y2F9_9CHLO|nr:hypothetical protein HYH03_006560 [Edaphochlamys debaryana]|eukprot:KAG2495287.1 hypothetical protein HYH03_006560 [Edaphochlamys debaryana]
MTSAVPTKYGMFMEHVYLKPGNPPPPGMEPVEGAPGEGSAGRTASPSAEIGTAQRDQGLNFKATVGRTGKNNDATFEPFKSLHQGDRFVDPSRRRLQQQNEARAKQVAPAPFKAASPMKHSTTPGDFVGTLQGKVQYMPGSTVYSQKTRADVQGQPRGFYTSPAKKGGFGFNKTTMSERQGFKGVATEYEYQHDPDELHRMRRIQEREADMAARQPAPFRPSNPPKKGGAGVPNITISKGKGVAGEYEYIPGADPAFAPVDPNAPPVDPNDPNASPARLIRAKAEETGPAFKPASLQPRHLGRQPEYIHDPEVPKIEAEHNRRKAEIARLAGSGAWRPNNAGKTDMVRSIVRMNLRG